MTSSLNSPQLISSRDNPLLKEVRRLSHGSTDYRKFGRFWAEGDHLVRAALLRGVHPEIGVFSESFWPLALDKYGHVATKNVVIPDHLYDSLSALESPARMGFVFVLPPVTSIEAQMASVILDRVQDAGNVGSILRSAGAFGFKQIIAVKGTAALWSPKVLRAGMGAHFDLRLVEGVTPEALEALSLPLLVTSSHAGAYLHQANLPWPCAWVMGHEGQGVSPALEARAAQRIRIAQPGGEESLNVAAAAAICLHASGAGRG